MCYCLSSYWRWFNKNRTAIDFKYVNVAGLLCISFACVLQENVWGFIFVTSELAHRAELSLGLAS